MQYLKIVFSVFTFVSTYSSAFAQQNQYRDSVLNKTTAEDSLQQNKLLQSPENFIEQVSGKISRVQRRLEKQTLKVLRKYNRQEQKLHARLFAKDSMVAKEVFQASIEKVKQLQNEFESVPDRAMTKIKGEYDAYMDTLQSTFKFLKGKINVADEKTKALQQKLTTATSKLNVMQGKLQKADEIKKYLRERRQYLRQHLEKFGMVKQLKKLDKASYYYNAYLTEYKTILKDRKKLEQKAMSVLYRTTFFKKFVTENSQLASLFRLPSGNTSVNPLTAITTAQLSLVQTRASVNQMIQTNMAVGGPNSMAQARQQMQVAQAEISKLKDKISQLGSADAEIPSFKPNTEKTKSFFRRLEYSANLQFGKANKYLPSSSDLSMAVGYKLNSKSSFGLGAAYSLGLGSSRNNIKLTHNGIGIRTYIDTKIKGNFFVTGGYEQNYYNQFKNFQQLQNTNGWKTAGLLGLTKKVTFKAKKSLKVQVLYDFLSYQKAPATQPIIFRTGINWK
jgi:hypothetical protein